MEKSGRPSSEKDIEEMFDLFTNWLDEPTVSFCGPSQSQNIPSTNLYVNNQSISSCVCFNGSDFSEVLDDLPTLEVRYGEDTLFFLSLLSKGFGNRVSHLFSSNNVSLKGKLNETVWSGNRIQRCLERPQKNKRLFPQFLKSVWMKKETELKVVFVTTVR